MSAQSMSFVDVDIQLENLLLVYIFACCSPFINKLTPVPDTLNLPIDMVVAGQS